MKYYVYISDAKVDMLLPQISDAHKKKVATEFGFDVKVFSAKRKVEAEENEDRIARLETVLSFIREFGNLGTVAKPDEYIEDSLPMYFTDLGVMDDSAAYFTGKQLNAIIGLGGSIHHVLGAGKPQRIMPDSLTMRILMMIKLGFPLPENEMAMGMDMIKHAYEQLEFQKLPLENLRFMAKRLAVTPYKGLTMILGTPLYVAKDD